MDAIDRRLRERLQSAGMEMTARPLPRRELGEPRVGRQSLRPLMAAGALAVALAVGGVLGGIGLHGRLSAGHGAPAGSPLPLPSLLPGTPAPNSPAPLATQNAGLPADAVPPFRNVSAVWDSTDKQIVAFDGSSIWTWQGVWVNRTPRGSDIGGNGFLVDAPGLHGVVFLGSSAQLWTNSGSVTPLPVPFAPNCMNPFEATWDLEHNQLVVVFTDQCGSGTQTLPAETWTYDAHAWQRHADAPAVREPLLTWDPGDKAAVLLGSLAPLSDTQAWTWTGTTWARAAGTRYSFPTGAQGAAWDATQNGVVVWSPALDGAPARAQKFRAGTYTEIIQQDQPGRTEAIIADSTFGRMLALGQSVIPAQQKPNPDNTANPYFVLEWTGTGWKEVTYAELSASS